MVRVTPPLNSQLQKPEFWGGVRNDRPASPVPNKIIRDIKFQQSEFWGGVLFIPFHRQDELFTFQGVLLHISTFDGW
jgi:hypothetical protein